jgi:hypothetical protein
MFAGVGSGGGASLPRHAGRKAGGAGGARCLAVKGECPAPRRRAAPTAQPFVLDGLPGSTACRPRSVAGEGRAFGACCFAGKLRSPAGRALAAFGWGGLTPTSFPTSTSKSFPTSTSKSFPTRRGGVPLASVVERICPGHVPEGGVVRPRRKVRFAQLIQRHGRDLGVPSARAASGGNLSLTWLPLRVVLDEYRLSAHQLAGNSASPTRSRA